MAEVYRALDRSTGRDVVLKIPHVNLAGDLVAFGRYRKEMETVASLDHPGMQRLLADPSSPFLVFDYVDGVSLRSYLHHHQPLPVELVISIGLQLAETLDYIHGQGVVHRDLKPENILIGPDLRVTLTDFGIATRVGSRMALSHLANTVGTPDYMAPEQVRGDASDARTDVYALGVLLFELLTGQVPYPATESDRTAVQNPPLVRGLRPEVAPALEAVVYRAMRRRPAERYPSMAALAYDLSHLEEATIPQRYEPDEPGPKPPGDLPPWRTTIPILLVVFAVLLVAGFVAQLLHHTATAP